MKKSPHSRSELFWAFTWLALQGFGGVLPVAQRELVEKRAWYTDQEFLEEWAVAQVMPGPNIVNLAIIYGSKHFGFLGALTAVAGMLLFPLLVLIVIAIFSLNYGDQPVISGALRGMGAVAAGLIAGTSLKLAKTLKTHPLGYGLSVSIALTCFMLVAWVRVPLIYTLLTLGFLSIYMTYRKVRDDSL
jgi:chromate transporter